ncbi:MAG: hypothetical protein GXO47_11655 [Chlorobi bacterium]|nr:hypothetical protein [Chlorobiota bacterium]
MKRILIVLYILLSEVYVFSQEQVYGGVPRVDNGLEEQRISFKDRLSLGGNLGLMFGSYTNIVVAPVMGIRWSKRFASEVGIEYNYTKDSRYEPDYTYNQYGGRISGQFFVTPELYAHAEFAGLSMEQYYLNAGKERNFVPFLYLGAGYRQYVSGNSYVSFRIMFDVLNDKNSPYSPGEPFYSVGFGIGL